VSYPRSDEALRFCTTTRRGSDNLLSIRTLARSGARMAIYALWNNKGGVGKSYLTFQVACEYARTHRDHKILVIDLCPQANASSMLLGGMERGEQQLDAISMSSPKRTIAGYIEDRIRSPYVSPQTGASYITQISTVNSYVPSNLYLVVGDEELEIQSSRVSNAKGLWRCFRLDALSQPGII
jgi:chromosome partitioning protein